MNTFHSTLIKYTNRLKQNKKRLWNQKLYKKKKWATYLREMKSILLI